MYARPLDFAPDTKSQYSNYGYLLGRAVVEKVTGIPFFEFIKETLLQPAGSPISSYRRPRWRSVLLTKRFTKMKAWGSARRL
jgi:CubicO group peptidase (beta-lactamase class C family)